MKSKDEIVSEIYDAYGSDSGVLLGIKEKDVVRAIVEFTLNRIDPLPSSSVTGEEEMRLTEIINKRLYHIWKGDDNVYSESFQKWSIRFIEENNLNIAF